MKKISMGNVCMYKGYMWKGLERESSRERERE